MGFREALISKHNYPEMLSILVFLTTSGNIYKHILMEAKCPFDFKIMA
jgi:hypothetical protein